MTEILSESVVERPELVEDELEKIRFLSELTGQPDVFLFAQNQLLFDRDLSHLQRDGELNAKGLPTDTDEFYQREAPVRAKVSDRLPAVLNLGSGAESSRKLDAVNVDVSLDGRPEVVADVQHLPFADDSFSVVRASHVLEHIPQDQILSTLLEWRRVLHEDGVLHIAVPDADVTFKEIIDGQTPKGALAYSLTESTAPLAQIYGLGYDDPKTDRRWGHTIIFSYALLERYLRAAGFTNVERRTREEDLAHHCGVDDDSQNHYSLLVSAGLEKLPHVVDAPLPERTFRDKCRAFLESHPEVTPTSFVIPVHNEARNLPHFLAFLENASNQLCAEREFIFVVNGCTDNSEQIIRDYLGGSYVNGRVVRISDRGIVPAFKAGIQDRRLNGFVGKLDADTVLHPHTLDLMQMFLSENDGVQVTYAEPTPLDGQGEYNRAEHNPIMRSRRLYYHGRTSLYRGNPMAELTDQDVPSELKAEDIYLSFFYAYFHGLGSMARTPHALVYSRTVQNFEDLVAQASRSKSEIGRVYAAYPPFRTLGGVLERAVYSRQYRSVTQRASEQATDGVNEWTRLRTTK
jgi:SAM-dependent methyltransferase